MTEIPKHLRPLSIIFLFVTIVLSTTILTAQPLSRKLIRGKVNSSIDKLSGISVSNKYSRENTTTINEGYFAINARPGDTLVFSDINFVTQNIAVTSEIYEDNFLNVNLENVPNQIQEVIVEQHNEINAVAMGILQAQPRSYSKAERALKRRGVSDFSLDNANSFDIGAIFSDISGKKKDLFRDLAVERKLATHDIIEKYFSDEYFEKKMKIPENRVEGFKFYLIESAEFSKAIKDENINLSTWIMAGLATKYNRIAMDDKK